MRAHPLTFSGSSDRFPLMAEREFTIEEVAGELGVAESTVRRWIREGRIQGTRRPALWSFSAAEVERLRAEQERRAG